LTRPNRLAFGPVYHSLDRRVIRDDIGHDSVTLIDKLQFSSPKCRLKPFSIWGRGYRHPFLHARLRISEYNLALASLTAVSEITLTSPCVAPDKHGPADKANTSAPRIGDFVMAASSSG
jgi:hypothetical protein